MASWNEMKEAKAKGLDVPGFYLASWNEMKEAKAKGLDVPSFYLFIYLYRHRTVI
ncbi:hypothetical protein [Acetivibrio straminisolvens]|uniref:Uncharacterized protein n=1 Tax=Acetivibrio straminisolvens JCM 21531 TaxID=1294263 RepID=W4V7U4_9FIRM|nr:hypothetical protein [Acetivibrio straminisolvens]GAE89425.1 hypothetical protein JCM21531_2950 [Acetivibrio straminisolvens JCM 21531]